LYLYYKKTNPQTTSADWGGWGLVYGADLTLVSWADENENGCLSFQDRTCIHSSLQANQVL